MNEPKKIEKGSIVKYKDGHYRVTRKTRNTVNLGGTFSGKIHHKGVPIGEVVEDEKAWYEAWTQSETYKCM
jgi:hypothetical protein